MKRFIIFLVVGGLGQAAFIWAGWKGMGIFYAAMYLSLAIKALE